MSKNSHEWVRKGCCIEFQTDKGLVLDVDNMTFRKAKSLAEGYLRIYKLEGYLIVKSSEMHYHIVFNRYLTWKKILHIIFSTVACIAWGCHQARKEKLTVRVSKKNGRNKPKIILQKGKTDKLISDYLKVYDLFREY